MYGMLKDKSVLYVEDDELVLKNVAKLMRGYFKDFRCAKDAKSAFEIFENHKIDILLVDIELPKVNGIEFIKRVRKIEEYIPVVIISAYTKVDYLLESVELGLEKYIVKPFTTKKIYELLRLLDSHYKSHEIVEILDGVFMNYSTKTICFESKRYPLTQKELDFLNILYHKRFISYDELEVLWVDEIPSQDAIRSFIKKLRKKLPKDILGNRQSLGYYLKAITDEVA